MFALESLAVDSPQLYAQLTVSFRVSGSHMNREMSFKPNLRSPPNSLSICAGKECKTRPVFRFLSAQPLDRTKEFDAQMQAWATQIDATSPQNLN